MGRGLDNVALEGDLFSFHVSNNDNLNYLILCACYHGLTDKVNELSPISSERFTDGKYKIILL